MHAAVDMEDLTSGHGQQVRQQGQAGLGDHVGVEHVPAQRGSGRPGVLEGTESRNGLGGQRLDRPGRYQVDPDPVRTEIARQVPRQRLERGFRHPHPVVRGPGHRGVKVESDHRRTGTIICSCCHQHGPERLHQGLERVGGDMESDLDLLPVGLEDVTSQALGWGIADGVHQAIESVPLGLELFGGCRYLGRVGDVEFEYLDFDGQLSGRPAGERQTSTGSAQHQLGAFLLGRASHSEGQRGVSQYASDEDALSFEESHASKGYCRVRHRALTRGVLDVLELLDPVGRTSQRMEEPKCLDTPSMVCPMRIGILGGTGPAGRGLAVRLAAVGDEVVLGSRDGERAAGVAAGLVDAWPDHTLAITGGTNEECAGAEIVVMATPWDGAVATVRPLADELAGKVVVSMANALVKEGREFLALMPPRGSVAAMVQAALPHSLVSASFHHLPASEMEKLTTPMAADVLVCSDHREAAEATVALVDRIDGLRGIDAGSLSQAAAIEAFTAVLITVNIRHKVHAAVQLAGFPDA